MGALTWKLMLCLPWCIRLRRNIRLFRGKERTAFDVK